MGELLNFINLLTPIETHDVIILRKKCIFTSGRTMSHFECVEVARKMRLALKLHLNIFAK